MPVHLVSYPQCTHLIRMYPTRNIPISQGTGLCTGFHGLAPALGATPPALPLLPPPYPGGACGGLAGTPWITGPTTNGAYHCVFVCGTNCELMIALPVLSDVVYPL